MSDTLVTNRRHPAPPHDASALDLVGANMTAAQEQLTAARERLIASRRRVVQLEEAVGYWSELRSRLGG